MAEFLGEGVVNVPCHVATAGAGGHELPAGHAVVVGPRQRRGQLP